MFIQYPFVLINEIETNRDLIFGSKFRICGIDNTFQIGN
jgi:hypothetical protein